MRAALLATGAVLLALVAYWSIRAGGGGAPPLAKSLPERPRFARDDAEAVLVPPVRPEPEAPATASRPGAAAPPTTNAVREDRGDRSRRPPSAVLYRHASHDELFPGERWVIAEGLWDAGVAFADDEASAADVPEGVILTLYADAGGNGARVSLGPGSHNLASLAFNDVASSARVARAGVPNEDAPMSQSTAVQLFENLPREGPGVGRVWSLPLAEARATRLFAARDGFFENGVPLAIWIPAEMEASLFDEPDGRGFALVLGPGFHELTRFAGRVSSVRVRRTRDD